jgi:hypothetical protein
MGKLVHPSQKRGLEVPRARQTSHEAHKGGHPLTAGLFWNGAGRGLACADNSVHAQQQHLVILLTFMLLITPELTSGGLTNSLQVKKALSRPSDSVVSSALFHLP